MAYLTPKALALPFSNRYDRPGTRGAGDKQIRPVTPVLVTTVARNLGRARAQEAIRVSFSRPTLSCCSGPEHRPHRRLHGRHHVGVTSNRAPAAPQPLPRSPSRHQRRRPRRPTPTPTPTPTPNSDNRTFTSADARQIRRRRTARPVDRHGRQHVRVRHVSLENEATRRLTHLCSATATAVAPVGPIEREPA